MLQQVDIQISLVIVAVGIVGILSALPFEFRLVRLASLASATINSKISFRTYLRLILPKLVLFISCVYSGLYLAERLGVHITPVLFAIIHNRAVVHYQPILIEAIITGLIFGFILAILMFLMTRERISDYLVIPLWARLIAGIFNAAIFEEIIFRLFLLTLCIWLLNQFFKVSDLNAKLHMFWAANCISAISFSLGHLPVLRAFKSLHTKFRILSVLVNFLAGLVFGYLFWFDGLESAVLAHMVTDASLQIGTRLFLEIRKLFS